MSRNRFIPLIVASATLVAGGASLPGFGLQSGPSPSVAGEAELATLADVFTELGRVRLEGSGEEPIGDITGLAFDDGGRIAVADRQSHRVFVFDRGGVLQRILGGSGEGPGEFKIPLDVAFGSDGKLYVAEAGSPRITGFDGNLALDTVLQLGEAYYATKLATVGNRLLAYVNTSSVATPRLRLLTEDGQESRRFHLSHPAYVETPYWSATTRRVMAASSRWIVAGGNLIYPLARYTSSGSLIDSVGRPPREWRQAGRPKPGTFSGPERLREFEEWRRTFTTIQSVAILQDRYLVVSHQRLNPEVLSYEDAEYFADIYDLRKNVKLWTGIRLPGPILAGGEALTLLLRGPPQGWLIGRYQMET